MSIQIETIVAELKEKLEVYTTIGIDFNEDLLSSTKKIEDVKKELIYRLKNEMHKKISILSMDDIKFHFVQKNKL